MITVSGSAAYRMTMCVLWNHLCQIWCYELTYPCWSQGCEDGYKYLSRMRDGTPDPELFADHELAEADLPYHDDQLTDNLCNTIRLFDKSLPRLRNIRKNPLRLFSKSWLSSKKTVWAYSHPKKAPNILASGCCPKVFLLKYIFYF